MNLLLSAPRALLLLVAITAQVSAGALVLKDAVRSPADFPLAVKGHVADILVDKSDPEVVHIAADLLANDIGHISGTKPRVVATLSKPTAPVIVIGTLDKSPLIADLVARGKLNPAPLAGKWETFVIVTVSDPFPGISSALVIAGSDRRGTAYGVITLSEALGVSPWEWWADVAPGHRDTLVVAADAHLEGPPSVKYRGIFLNDEDWGLQPWAAKTFEPETKDIGPKTYAKICELLLRLKANTLWPAMHSSTRAFNHYPENKVVADRYAIVMGSSHAEPMLRNNVDEWSKDRGPWDYDKNRAGILGYWEERVRENGRYENSYTLGMRGIHDSAMPGDGTTREKVARLQQVLADQRALLAQHVNPHVEQIPQIFVPYKEVLALYQNGLKVPDDVTLVWPDDNHGYIRQLSTPEEQKRAGGAGVYYHLSYWGKPEDYLWLCTTPPSLIWEEMRKAYDHGARTFWIVNVGDIKPGEIGMEFFLRMAWNTAPWDETAQSAFLADWAARTFGPEHAADIAAILDEYYRLNFPAKPEHLLLTRFTANYGEIDTRLDRFAALVAKTDALYEKIPAAQRDAFYELVVYPVRGSALINRSHLLADPAAALAAHDQIQAETRIYNGQIAGGKWNSIMSSAPRKRPVFQAAAPKPASATPPSAPVAGGYLSLEAEHPARTTAGTGTEWKILAGLGRSGDSIALLPAGESVPATASLAYDFTTPETAGAKVLVYALPTHALNPGLKLRYSASIDNDTPQVVDLDSAEFSAAWSANVLRAAAIGTTQHKLGAGKHTLTLRPLDPGLVFDKVVIDLGGLQPTHLGPPATDSR